MIFLMKPPPPPLTGGDVASTHLSLLHPGAAVQTQVDVSVVVEELLQHVQHPRHLSEDQHPMAAGLQLPQQSVERLKFTYTHTAGGDYFTPSVKSLL